MTADGTTLDVGICDWTIELSGRAEEAMAWCAEHGMDCLQISPVEPADTLSYALPDVRETYLRLVEQTGVKIASVGLTATNSCPLATDPRGPAWLDQTIDTAAALGCSATLVAFFGKGNLRGEDGLKPAAVEAVAARLAEAAPRAAEKGVILGLENTLSAEENLELIERVGSESVGVYYDIANSTNLGRDAAAEIRTLGGRICEVHLKNTDGLFGDAGIPLGPIRDALADAGFSGHLVMERSFGEDATAYYVANAARIREAFGLT